MRRFSRLVKALRAKGWFRECVACVSAGMGWSDALRLDPVERSAFLEEYGEQQQAAYDEAQTRRTR